MEKGVYTEDRTENFLRSYVPVARHVLADSFDEAEKAAKKIGFPLVLKIISPDAVHKSEIQGVRFVKNFEELTHSYAALLEIVEKKDISCHGILVQEYIEGSYVLIGLKKDPVFGHVLAFGIGGIYTEVLKDVSFRICPIRTKDAEAMIEELHMKILLFGYRGAASVHIPLLKKVLVAVSRIPLKHKEIQELDINPFVINHRKGFVVDARMVV